MFINKGQLIGSFLRADIEELFKKPIDSLEEAHAAFSELRESSGDKSGKEPYLSCNGPFAKPQHMHLLFEVTMVMAGASRREGQWPIKIRRDTLPLHDGYTRALYISRRFKTNSSGLHRTSMPLRQTTASPSSCCLACKPTKKLALWVCVKGEWILVVQTYGYEATQAQRNWWIDGAHTG